jgi:hypothetical protein
MLAFRSVVSVLLRELGDFSLHPQGRPCGRPPAALRPGSDATLTGVPPPPFSAAGTDAAAWSTRRSHPAVGATSGPHPAGPPGTTAVNDGQSSSQVSRPIQGAMVVGQAPRFSLARRKPGVQIPSPPPLQSPGRRPGGSHAPKRPTATRLRPRDGAKRTRPRPSDYETDARRRTGRLQTDRACSRWDASSVQTAPDGSRRIVWMIMGMIKASDTEEVVRPAGVRPTSSALTCHSRAGSSAVPWSCSRDLSGGPRLRR